MTHSASSITYDTSTFDLLVETFTSWFGPASSGAWSVVKLGSSGHVRIEVRAGDIYVKPGDTVWIKGTSVLVVPV